MNKIRHKKIYKTPAKVRKANRRWYLRNKDTRKISMANYFKENSEKIIFKREDSGSRKYRQYAGHAAMIYSSLRKYAHMWKLPLCEKRDFMAWAKDSNEYRVLYMDWKANGFTDDYGPIICRRSHAKNKGYTVDNMYWNFKKAVGISKAGMKEVENYKKEHALRQRKANDSDPTTKAESIRRLLQVQLQKASEKATLAAKKEKVTI